MSKRILVVVNPFRAETVAAGYEAAEALKNEGLIPVMYEGGEVPADAAAALVLGGDGTMLRAAELTKEVDMPLLGVNHGRVGFLAEVEQEELTLAARALAQKTYRTEVRGTLDVVVTHPDGTEHREWALNEVTVEREDVSRTLEVAISVEGQSLSSFGCDGVVVSTATGSTAHAFSAGGPVMWPNVDALLFVPLAAHALFARPLVVGPESWFTIDVIERSITAGVLVCDGSRILAVPPGASVDVRRGSHQVRLVRIGDAPFTNRLVNKFELPTVGWRDNAAAGSRVKNDGADGTA